MAYYENGVWTVPQDSIAGNIQTAAIYKDEIYIGGIFASINGDPSMKHLAKLRCPDFDIAAGCLSGLKEFSKHLDVKIFPNPLRDKLQLEFEQNVTIDKVTIINTLGQELYKLFKPMPQQEIGVSFLPSGIYFIKVENTLRQSMIKFLKE